MAFSQNILQLQYYIFLWMIPAIIITIYTVKRIPILGSKEKMALSKLRKIHFGGLFLVYFVDGIYGKMVAHSWYLVVFRTSYRMGNSLLFHNEISINKK